MNKNTLTCLLLKYKNGYLEKKELISAVSLFVYKFPLRNYNWKEDDCSDFFIFFYPKILRMIETFQIRKIPFEAYLIKTLKLQIKTFAAKRTAETAVSKILKYKEFWPHEYFTSESCCYEKPFEYEPKSSDTLQISEKLGFFKSPAAVIKKPLKKRILMLGLKHANSLSESDMFDVINISGCSNLWFESSREKLKKCVEKRQIRKTILTERKNRFFCRLYCLHESYASETLAANRCHIFNEILRVKTQIDSLAARIEKISELPTHQDIADIMKIPKGSVDSGLFYLRLYLEKK